MIDLIYCFVHAPVHNGWNGELLLTYTQKHGPIKYSDVEKRCAFLFPNDDFNKLHCDNNVSRDRVRDYLKRRQNGLMQRISISGTYEDLLFDEWLRGLVRNYPYLANYAEFLIGEHDITT